MTRGIVLFALNNTAINYVKLAEISAQKAKKFINHPITLISDIDSIKKIENKNIFDEIICLENENYYTKTFKDGTNKVQDYWKNSHRSSIFDLTPYDETLVLDVDYIVNSNILNYCWDQPHDFLIYKDSYDIANWRSSKDYKFISQYSIPFYWATTFFFKKTENTKSLFELIKHIKSNWNYYNFLYQLSSPNFRNDFAFSIAIHLMNGKVNGDFAKKLPGKLYYSLDSDVLVEAKDTTYYFLLNKKDNIFVPAKIDNLDIHIMNKFSILKVL